MIQLIFSTRETTRVGTPDFIKYSRCLSNREKLRFCERTKSMVEKSLECLRVFYSYASPDTSIRDEIEESLSTLKQQKYISSYHDMKIKPSSWWKTELDRNLEDAHLILLLISPSYISSDYCHNNEM